MRVFGLTGGIASGKSTVARLFAERGAAIIDADELAREVVAPGTPGLAALAARFPGVVAADGTLDRAALGERVFSDAGERAALNALTHPLVQARALERLAALEAQGAALVLYDVPLLFENGLEGGFEAVVLVWVPEATQLDRLQRRNQLTLAQAQARLAAQLPLDSKRPKARWVIDNSGPLSATAQQVDEVLAAMRALT